MLSLPKFAIDLLKDASKKPESTFDFIRVASGGWQTPYGYINDLSECEIIDECLEILTSNGFIEELSPDGNRYRITNLGIKYIGGVNEKI